MLYLLPYRCSACEVTVYCYDYFDFVVIMGVSNIIKSRVDLMRDLDFGCGDIVFQMCLLSFLCLILYI